MASYQRFVPEHKRFDAETGVVKPFPVSTLRSEDGQRFASGGRGTGPQSWKINGGRSAKQQN
jgi:hypothetical protein